MEINTWSEQQPVSQGRSRFGKPWDVVCSSSSDPFSVLRGEERNLERRGERERIPGELPFRTNGVKRLSHQPLSSIPRTFRFGFTAISCFLLPPSLPNPASAILIRTFSKREFEERTESFSKFRLQARWIITERSSENKFQMIREFLIILPRGRKRWSYTSLSHFGYSFHTCACVPTLDNTFFN